MIVLILWSAVAMAQVLPKNPLAGREVLEKQGCLNCHAVNGTGGTVAPDFGKQVFIGDEYDLLSKMWNHSEQMLAVMSRTRTERPQFNGTDFRELSNFLYFVRYLGQPGNSSVGKELFVSKNCVECHSVGMPVSGKIPLDSMKVFKSPVKLAQEMWNHAVAMERRRISKKVSLPVFSDNEFADLAEYLRQASSLKTEERIYSYPGDPTRGLKLFKEKGCEYCHVQKNIGPRLDETNTNQSVMKIAGIMWDHSEKMLNAARQMKKPFPLFTGNQMADVISYLYFSSTPKTTGSAEAGARLFKDDGCSNCHFAGNKLKAPTVGQLAVYRDKDEFLAALWNHVSQMEEILVARGKKLPKLLPNDIKSLYLFVNENATGEH